MDNGTLGHVVYVSSVPSLSFACPKVTLPVLCPVANCRRRRRSSQVTNRVCNAMQCNALFPLTRQRSIIHDVLSISVHSFAPARARTHTQLLEWKSGAWRTLVLSARLRITLLVLCDENSQPGGSSGKSHDPAPRMFPNGQPSTSNVTATPDLLFAELNLCVRLGKPAGTAGLGRLAIAEGMDP